MTADAYQKIQARKNLLKFKRSACMVHNVTQDTDLQADCNQPNAITTTATAAIDVHIGDVIRTRTGHALITGEGQQEKQGLITFPAPKVQGFYKHYRFSQVPADHTGRPPAHPALLREDIPVVSHNGNLITAICYEVRQGDVLENKDTRYSVQGLEFVNGHVVCLAVVE